MMQAAQARGAKVSDGGVLLVRPDLYVAARHVSAPGSPGSAAHWLRQALTSVLGTSLDEK